MYLSSSFICGKKLKLITEQKQIERSIFYFWIYCWTNSSNIYTHVLRPGNTSHFSVNNNPDLFMSYLNFDNHSKVFVCLESFSSAVLVVCLFGLLAVAHPLFFFSCKWLIIIPQLLHVCTWIKVCIGLFLLPSKLWFEIQIKHTRSDPCEHKPAYLIKISDKP